MKFQLPRALICLLLSCWSIKASGQDTLGPYFWMKNQLREIDTRELEAALPHPVIKPNPDCILGSTQPLFPGCLEIEDYEARKKCSERLLFRYFFDRFEYDMQSCDHSGISYAILVFDVSEIGLISNVRVVRRRRCDFEDAAVAALSQMIEEKVIWEPATVDGNPVKGKSSFMAKIHIE